MDWPTWARTVDKMRLKNSEFTRLCREVVEPSLRTVGFGRSKDEVSGPHWIRQSGDGWLIVSLQNDRPGLGGRFTVEFEFAPQPASGGSGPRARFFRLLTSAERETVRERQNEVITAFPVIDPKYFDGIQPPWLAEQVARTWRPVIDRYLVREDVWLRYTGEADVRRWLEWLAPLLPLLAGRFEAKPDGFDPVVGDEVVE